MALLFIDSFDHYDSASILDKWTSNFTACSILVGAGRCGTNCMYLGTYNDLIKGIPFGSLTGTVGFAAWINSHYTLTTAEIHLSTLGGSYPLPHLYLWYHAIDGSLSVVRLASPNVVLGRTVPDVIRQNDWYFLEWQATIDPTAGAVTVRVNNVEVLAVTGVNTVGDQGGPSFPLDLRSVGFHCGSNEEWRLDDLYVLDSTGSAPTNTFLGDCRVEYLKPRAAGGNQAFPVVVGTSGSHWLAVNDNAIPDEDATYVEANAAGLTDTNLYQPTGLPSGPIFGAQLSLHAKKTEIGPRVVAPVVNGVTGPPHFSPSSDTYRYLHTMFATNPATGLPWTIAEINAIDAGVTVVS